MPEATEAPVAFSCDILTPERSVFSGDVAFLRAAGAAGDVEILPRHEPLMTPLAIGVMTVSAGGEEKRFAVHGGFLDMDGQGVTVLADSAENADEIDVARAQEALDRAKERLAQVSGRAEEMQIDPDRAKIALMRAMIRLQVVGKASPGEGD